MTRRGWLLALVVALFVTVPVLEVWLLLRVGNQIGVLPTICLLVVTALMGAWLVRREGTRAWRAIVEASRRQEVPTEEIATGALVLIGGVLLMLPGFATDVVGLVCLLPATRPLPRALLTGWAGRGIAARSTTPTPRVGPTRSEGITIIPGEVVEPEENRAS